MKKGAILTAIFIILILCIAVVWFYAFREKEKPEALIITKPKFGNISMSVTGTGTINPVKGDTAIMQIVAPVNKACIDNLNPGERVAFTVDAFVGEVFYGAVREIRQKPVVASNAVTYTTIIDVMNNSLKLKPGMLANIIFYTNREDNAMLIPLKALNFSPDPNLVNETIIKNPYPHAIKNSNPEVPIHQNNHYNTKSISVNAKVSPHFLKNNMYGLKQMTNYFKEEYLLGSMMIITSR